MKGLLKMIYVRPTDLSVDEVLYEVHRSASEMGARRVVINSVSGFQLALAPSDQDDFREALYRLLATLTGEGVTTLLTMEVPDLMGQVCISSQGISFLADNVILMRYAEIESQLRKMLTVVKMRTSNHAKELRQYQIDGSGIRVEQPFTQYAGVLSGIPTLRAVMGPQPFTSGLTEQEEELVHLLLSRRDSSADQLAQSMNLNAEQVQQMLDKLVATGYVIQTIRAGAPSYRVSLIAPVPAPSRGWVPGRGKQRVVMSDG